MIMRARYTVAVLLAAGIAGGALLPERAAVVRAQRTLQIPDEQPTFRVGTRIATIDAVVIDDKGRHVTDLTPADFEIVERGRTQTIRQAVYVRVVNPPGTTVALPTAAAPDTADARVAPTAPAEAAPRSPLATGAGTPLGRANASRVIAIVVDDLGLSFESTVRVRKMLAQYVETKLAPGDLVAIIRTAGGVGTLQQFTTDRRLLRSAIDRVRYSIESRVGIAAFDAVSPDSSTGLVSAKDPSLSIDRLRSDVATAGTLGALEYVLRGIETMPGRKSVVFVSEGFDLGIKEAKFNRGWTQFTRVMDRANRAGVVVYSIDARGLQTAGLTAEDDPQTPKMDAFGGPGGGAGGGNAAATVRSAGSGRLGQLMNSQESLIYLAQQTGGFAVVNTNGLTEGMSRIIDDTVGYYLIGFDTSLGVSEPWDPNDVRLRVKRDGVHVRARRGLFGPAEKEKRPEEGPPADPLVAAALSPFSTGAIDVRLTTLFAHDKQVGSYVRSLFYIDPAGMTFVDEPDGRKKADLTVLLMAVGDNGVPVGQARIEVPLSLDDAAYRLLRQRGLLYSARLPVSEPGGYQVRAAVQDMHSQAVGTAAQFVEVPKVGKGYVALSGVVMMDVASAGATPASGATSIRADAIADGVLGEPAIKIFKPGSEVVYTCEIYDGRGKRKDSLSTRATLIRDGRVVYTTAASPVVGAPKDVKPVGAVPVGGRLSLGRGLPRGTYTLQVSVGPAKGDDKKRHATQWVDFEVR
jgi:VWFA-related protein